MARSAYSRGSRRAGLSPWWWVLVSVFAFAGVMDWREDRRRQRREVADPPAGYPEIADGHGRFADAPSAIPARGWRDILWRVMRKVMTDNVFMAAAGVAFYMLLALAPFITAFVSLYGLAFDVFDVERQLNILQGMLPPEVFSILGDQMSRLTRQSVNTLGLGFFFGLLIALWSANAAMKAILETLNSAYEEEEKRGFLLLTAQTLILTLGAILFMSLSIALVALLPVALNFLGLAENTATIISLGRWPLLLMGVALALAILYRFGPSRRRAKWRWVTWGSAFASLFFLLASLAFSWYAANLGSYNETYGSLGAVVVLMTWTWISVVVVIIGAELNAEIEHQTAIDSTIPPAHLMGMRGATMADTLGKSAG